MSLFSSRSRDRAAGILLSLLILLSIVPLPVFAAPPTQSDAIDEALFLDVEWYRENLVQTVDLWNGGLDGNSGMGVYQEGFDGYFHVTLDQQWRQMPQHSITAVAQSRAIYMNAEAYRAAVAMGDENADRFLIGVNKGVEFLLGNFWDAAYGGFYWEVNSRGRATDTLKQGYGNIHPLLALTHAYDVTGNQVYLDAALAQLAVIEEHFLDMDYPGSFRPNFNREFTQIVGNNNVDVLTHIFESVLALYDVTEGEQQEHIADLVVLHGDFIAYHLYHDQEGYTDRGYVAYNYDEQWQPSQIPYTLQTQWSGALHATAGHNIELAYLFSRAVERGFNPEWLDVAEKMIKFCMEYAIDADTGGMRYEITDYNGQPLEGNADNAIYVWWPQAETARALLHFTVVRGDAYGDAYGDAFKKVETLFNDYLTDPDYGGLYHGVGAEDGLQPFNPNKGDIWKVNYHYSMLFAEILRLNDQYPERIAELNGE